MPPALGLLLGLSLVGALQPSLEPLQYEPTEEGAILFADSYNSSAEVVLFKSVSASWDYYTNLTDKNAALQVGGGMGGDVTVGVSPAPGLLGGGGGGWGTVGTLGVVPFLPAGAFLGTSGWQTRAGTRSSGTSGVCPKLALGELLHRSDSPDPGTDPRLFLEVVASFKYLLFSFPTFPDRGQVSSVLVPARCHHIPVLCYARALPSPGAVGFLFGADPGSPKCAQATGWHQDGGCHPFIPVSPAQGMKPASGKRSRLWGISYQPSYVPAEFQQGAMLCASHRHLHVLPGICVCLGWI